MGRPIRDALTVLLAALFLAGCASTDEVRPQEGQVVLRVGSGGATRDAPRVSDGSRFRRLALLAPASDPGWQAGWVDSDRKTPGMGGGMSGFVAGLGVVQAIPVFLLAWPVAVGALAGMTVMGAWGGQMDDGKPSSLDAGDRSALLEAAVALRPDRLLRESAAEVLTARTGRPPLALPWYPTWGPDTPGTDPLADARRLGADGVLDLAVEVFGLATGEEADTLGVFVRVRARLLDPQEGEVRFERVLEYGPGRPLVGLPRPAAHAVDFLAMDQARVFRHEMREVILRMARVLMDESPFALGPP